MNNKYNIGDVVKINAYVGERRNDTYVPVVLHNKIAVIIQPKLAFNLEDYKAYEVIVCGQENKVYQIEERDIVERIE